VERQILLSAAQRYLRFYTTPLGRAILSSELELVERELAGCGLVLDVGCGPGVFEMHTAMSMVGLDVDRAMLELAAQHDRFVQGTAEKLPFREDSFGAVVFITSLEFVQDVGAALTEACRVLKDGGKLLAMVLNPNTEYFKSGVRRGGYFTRVRASPEDVLRKARAHFDVGCSYWLGISEEGVYETDEPEEGSLCVIRGVKKMC